MGVRTYDPKQVIITVGGVPMSGFADGSFLTVDRDDNQWTKVTGADGTSTRIKSNNRSGNMIITLKQSSPSNDVLSGFANVDELTNAGVVPILVKDLSGNSIFFSATGWVKKYPSSEFGKDLANREWVLDLVDLDVFVGSNGVNT
ncbi:MAG: DUF3277 family protein [Chlamydiales bacterium]|jgi:hypothetical protein|nr:DUF3277 family protein [Chlamydiales bacterium]